ncbi:MAG: penicillin-binding protein activator [bacterium]
MTVAVAFISGCESTPVDRQASKDSDNRPYGSTSKDIQALLSAAANASDSRANELRIRAAGLAAGNGNLQQATSILATVEIADSSNTKRYILVQADVAIQREDARKALEWLNDDRLDGNMSTQSDQIKMGQLRAGAYYVGRSFVASARERIFYDPLLSSSERRDNHEEIFNTLLELPAKSLSAYAEKAVTSDLRGWLSLAAMTKQYQGNPQRQFQELNRWKTAWGNHPAARDLPASLSTLSKVIENQPKVIGLLLPIQGSLGTPGRAIRDGIIAAKFSLESIVDINVYDTSNSDIQTLMLEAVANGAEMIIGPLDRDRVTAIAGMTDLPVPVLTLNRAYDGLTHPDLYQFGLAPEDEMIQVADQVFKEGKRNALAIYPGNEWGSRNFETFRSHWLSLGGNIVGSTTYQQQNDYSDLVKSLLEVDRSEKRATDLRRIVGVRFEFKPRRRQDIDFVFLLGNQNQARGINPTLAFFYAEDIPVYSTSHVYSFNESKVDAIDLNGIRFCDIPWKLTSTSFPPGPIQSNVQNQWPDSNPQLAPFYALGVDAFQLYPRLQQLKEVKGTKIFGTTGILQLNPDNVVVRELMWAQFSNGKVVSAPLVTEAILEP